MYTITGFGSMIADRTRTDAYYEAIRTAVRPGAVVCDIGGGTGILSLFACRFGAHKVYAVEPSDAIQVAREIAAANRFQNRIEFIQDISTRIELSERADIIVSDLRGILPLFQHHIPSIIDARERLLEPGGTLIPQVDTLWTAVVEAPELYQRRTGPWSERPYDFDMEASRPIVTNTWSKGRVTPDQLLTEARCWATLDYRSITETNVRGEVVFTANRAGTAHGLAVWFDTTLVEGIGYSNSPHAPELIYGNAFFPWPEPVSLDVDDTVSVALAANLVGEDYVWQWQATVLGQGDPSRIKAKFHQNTLLGTPLSRDTLRKRASTYVPHVNEGGQVDQYLLSLMNGERSLEQIADLAIAHFPKRFSNARVALTHIGTLAQRYT